MTEWMFWLCGGRPMTRGEYRFSEIFTGKPVYYFTDHYGRRWLATDKWAWFRVAVPDREFEDTP